MLKKFLIFFVLIGCTSRNGEVQTIAIINNKEFPSEIFIFFEQDTVIGQVNIDKGKHYFNVKNKVEVFFMQEKIGEGKIEYYIRNKNKLEEVYYHYPMGRKDWKNNDFQIAGGALREMYNLSKKRKIQYITFKSDYVKNLDNNWEIPNKKVLKMYNSIYKNDILTTETQDRSTLRPILPMPDTLNINK
jgi:hypothetical protein